MTDAAAVQYWTHEVAGSMIHFAFVDHRDYRFDGERWSRYDRYRSGPSWWRLTGETGTYVIDEAELPPEIPRWSPPAG